MTSFLYMRRKWIDRLSSGWTYACIALLLLLPLSIGLGLVIKSVPLLHQQSVWHLLTGTQWSPMEGHFGFLPFIVSSLLVTILSFILSAPVCLMAALYLTQYAPAWWLRCIHFIIDVLAGIPSVVYGVWGILVIVPFIGDHIAPSFGSRSPGYSLLAGGIVLAVMCIPYMLNMMIEVFRAIPAELTEASLSLGATRWETIRKVLLRQGSTGIMAAMGLGVSKALGETIAVLMVVGNVVQVPRSLLDPAYPLPALIANNYGDMMSVPLYDAALTLAALILFVIILLFNALTNVFISKKSGI